MVTKLLGNTTGNNVSTVIGLDHNLDLLKSHLHKPTNEFLEKNYSLELFPSINKPTRVTTSTATLIDNVFVSQKLETICKSVVLVDDLSDHYPSVLLISNVKKSYSIHKRWVRNFKPKSIANILGDLTGENWHENVIYGKALRNKDVI